jgi:hypothetical protein
MPPEKRNFDRVLAANTFNRSDTRGSHAKQALVNSQLLLKVPGYIL